METIICPESRPFSRAASGSFDRSMLTLFLFLGILQGASQEDSLLERLEREITGVVRKVRPSVVSIAASRGKGDALHTVQLSGIVYRGDGYILTDVAAIEGAEVLQVTTTDGRTLAAKRVAGDAKTGIALLRVEVQDLVPAELIADQELKCGLFVVTIGNAYGLSGTAAVGTLSGLDRAIRVGGRRFENMIQLAVPANPGDCGGMVSDSRGRLIGILHSVYSEEDDSDWLPLFGHRSSSPSFVAFATSGDTVRFVADRMIKHGRMVRGWLGVSVRTIDDGVEITKVEAGSPARKVGLRRGDVLAACDGEAVSDAAALQRKIEILEEPRTMRLTVRREGNRLDVEVRIELEPGRK